jgi:hypothetical protein
MKCLVAGWFSFEQMGATAGDLIARDIVCDRLTKENISFDVAVAPPFSDGVDWKKTDPSGYTDIIFICGPFGNGWPVDEFLAYFSGARFSGLNVSMLQPVDEWNPFKILYERDSSRKSNPDFTFIAPPSKVPVIGVILAHKQKEYGKRALHDDANVAIKKLLERIEVAIVHIDTALLQNEGGLRTPGEIESLIAKMDLVITTRLHGTVLSLKNGVPVIPIDPIAGGAKITQQVKTLGWPLLFSAEKICDNELDKAFSFCLTSKAKDLANQCSIEAKLHIANILTSFITEIKSNVR